MLSVYSVWHHFCFSTVLACLLSSRLVVYWEKQLKVVQYVLNLNFLKQTYIARFVVSIFLLFPGDKYILKSIFMFIYIYLYIKNIYFKCICFIIQKSTNQYVTKKNQLENLYTLLSLYHIQSAIESLFGASMTGIAYSLFGGQPLTILGSTGPVLVFEKILFKFCK